MTSTERNMEVNTTKGEWNVHICGSRRNLDEKAMVNRIDMMTKEGKRLAERVNRVDC